jgi:hypothetical protein
MIYFIKDTGTQAIKIGYSAKPPRRVGDLQTGNPHKLVLLGTVGGKKADEEALHVKFAQYRLEGEWFRGEIIEEVLSIISAYKKQRLQMRRKIVTTETGQDKEDGEPLPDVTGEDTLDKDSGIRGISRIPGLKMKRLSVKLTERPYEHKQGHTCCGAEIRYLLEFEGDVSDEAAGKPFSPLAQLRNALVNIHDNAVGLNHVFMDEDNAVIPFGPKRENHHIVGGENAVTGNAGEAFRVLVAWEKSLDPNYYAAKIKDVFMGENYTGEHPLKKAVKLVVSIR